jgi:proline iminopeptidase
MTTLEDVLYPHLEPLHCGTLQVDDLHTLYWETSGNPQGIPVIFVHGGPGAGTSPNSRRFFDPAKYHIVLLDQRGSGKSTPLGETRHNTTELLIGDLETLREHLGIRQWLVFGGSWGSTLSLAYAQAHPERCLGLVLRGIWLASKEEIDWWLYGVRYLFPKEWEAFANFIPEAERGDLLGAYQRRMRSSEPAVFTPAAQAWARYEGACVHLLPQQQAGAAFTDDAYALGIGLLEAHYFEHGAFLERDQLLKGAERIRHLPGFIVHGRYDAICPVRYAFQLADAWPEAQMTVVPDAGHSSYEPGIAAELVAATDRFAATGRFD